jgi:tRNA A37 N6-isopentenylltransferase MiaA
MIEFYKQIEPEKAKLVIKNDSRKLENILKRLLVHQTTDFTWNMQNENKFLILALDTTNTTWLEARIRKRIAEMVCDEGGLEETFALLWSMVQHFHKAESPKFTKTKIL